MIGRVRGCEELGEANQRCTGRTNRRAKLIDQSIANGVQDVMIGLICTGSSFEADYFKLLFVPV